jgi:DNA-binding MarR family transcriptional regulator
MPTRSVKTRITQPPLGGPSHTAFALNSSLGALAARVARRMTSELNTRLAAYELTTGQWAVLAALWQEDGLAQTEISLRTGIDTATLTPMLKRMSSRGLLHRVRDPHDNRYQRVHIGNRDDLPRDAVISMADEVNAIALAGFSREDKVLLTTLLQQALANLELHRTERFTETSR